MSYEKEWREILQYIYISYNIANGMVNFYGSYYDCDRTIVNMAWSLDYSPKEFLQAFKIKQEQLPNVEVANLEECDIDIFIAEHLNPSEVLYDLGRVLKAIANPPSTQTNYEIVQEYVRRAGSGFATSINAGWRKWNLDENVNISK